MGYHFQHIFYLGLDMWIFSVSNSGKERLQNIAEKVDPPPPPPRLDSYLEIALGVK